MSRTRWLISWKVPLEYFRLVSMMVLGARTGRARCQASWEGTSSRRYLQGSEVLLAQDLVLLADLLPDISFPWKCRRRRNCRIWRSLGRCWHSQCGRSIPGVQAAAPALQPGKKGQGENPLWSWESYSRNVGSRSQPVAFVFSCTKPCGRGEFWQLGDSLWS